MGLFDKVFKSDKKKEGGAKKGTEGGGFSPVVVTTDDIPKTIQEIALKYKIGSGMLTPLTESNAVAYFGESVSQIKAGELIRIVSYTDLARSVKNDTVNEFE